MVKPEGKIGAVKSLKWKGYRAKPLKRIYIPKANGNKRPLSIPTLYDRAMQMLQKLALEPIAETLADNHSYGFRSMRRAADAIEYTHQCLLSRGHAAQWILDADIKSCFDEISHDWLCKNIPLPKRILKQWLSAGYIERKHKYSTTKGTPQGGIISPLLANMTLDGLEGLIRTTFKKTVKASKNKKVSIVRYADDMLITGKSKAILEKEVKPLVQRFLAERGLELSQEKTKIRHNSEGIDFLGFTLRKYSGDVVMTKPSIASQKAFRKKIKTTLSQLKSAPQSLVIAKLNPIILGWMYYHRHVVSKVIFTRMDSWLWEKLWKWSRRRHPDKGNKWIKAKYFHRHDGYEWTFGHWIKGNNKTPFRYIRLMRKLPIKRHPLIRGAFNPYDDNWKDYKTMRLQKNMMAIMSELPYKLLVRQNGKCKHCGHLIDEVSRWHVHHKLPRSLGGKTVSANLVLLHPECHRQLHSLSTAGSLTSDLIHA